MVYPDLSSYALQNTTQPEMNVGEVGDIIDPLSQLEGYWKTNTREKVHVIGTHMKMGTESFEIETTSDDGLVFDGYHLKTISNGVVEWTKEGTEALFSC
jgi:hypothetical protein